MTASPTIDGAINSAPQFTPDALARPEEMRVDSMIDVQPMARRWLIEDLLPVGVVGILAAGGGTGKSFLSMQLALSVSGGFPFLGLPIRESGGVLLIAAEDDDDELHRRLNRIYRNHRDVGLIGDYEDRTMRENLYVLSRVAEDNKLTIDQAGAFEKTNMADRIISTARVIRNIRLIILDPISRFRSGDENSSDGGTRFIEAVEAIRVETGATVLLPHHMNKGGLQAGADKLTAEALRGSSALVDGARWAAAMATMRKDMAPEYGIKPEDASNYVRLDSVKNNYAPPWEGTWLRRVGGGTLESIALNRSTRERQEQRADDRYQETLPKIVELVRAHQNSGKPLTKRRIREFAGKGGVFGVGDQTLRSMVERAINDGAIREHPSADKHHGSELRTW